VTFGLDDGHAMVLLSLRGEPTTAGRVIKPVSRGCTARNGGRCHQASRFPFY